MSTNKLKTSHTVRSRYLCSNLTLQSTSYTASCACANNQSRANYQIKIVHLSTLPSCFFYTGSRHMHCLTYFYYIILLCFTIIIIIIIIIIYFITILTNMYIHTLILIYIYLFYVVV